MDPAPICQQFCDLYRIYLLISVEDHHLLEQHNKNFYHSTSCTLWFLCQCAFEQLHTPILNDALILQHKTYNLNTNLSSQHHIQYLLAIMAVTHKSKSKD